MREGGARVKGLLAPLCVLGLMLVLGACGSAAGSPVAVAERELSLLQAPTAEQARAVLDHETLETLAEADIAPEDFVGALFQKASWSEFEEVDDGIEEVAPVSFEATALDLSWVRSELATRLLAAGDASSEPNDALGSVMDVLGAEGAPTVQNTVQVRLVDHDGTWQPESAQSFFSAALAGQDPAALVG